MDKIIVDKILELTDSIKKNGREINGTKELTGVTFQKIDISKINLSAEENSIRDYYASLGINTQAIRSLEHNLYEFIYRGLKQAVEQTLYFDKIQDYTSRRFVFSTTDCISHVQILYRNKNVELFMYIRSTDVIKLLPWDLLFACKLLNRMLNECGFPETTKKLINIYIGSAHFYIKPAAMY